MKNFSAFVGLDGFIDNILVAVDQRFGRGNNFNKIEKIENFAERIQNASGKSTNIELFPIERRIGGNGPILAKALDFYNINVDLMGALDDEIFYKILHNINKISLCKPGFTNAIEFNDGKILLGITNSLDEISVKTISKTIMQLEKNIFKQDLFCFTNWTMIVNMNEILQYFLPKIPNNTICFFDLADPEKRPKQDLLDLLKILENYSKKCKTILGLNLKEAEQIARILKEKYKISTPINISEISSQYVEFLCKFIKNNLKINEVFIHDSSFCYAINEKESAFINGKKENLFVQYPMTTTGAGDHFNAGYLIAKLQNKNIENSLRQAYKISSHFVQTGALLPI